MLTAAVKKVTSAAAQAAATTVAATVGAGRAGVLSAATRTGNITGAADTSGASSAPTAATKPAITLQTATRSGTGPHPDRVIRQRKAVLTLTPAAVRRLKEIASNPPASEGQLQSTKALESRAPASCVQEVGNMIRVGVKTRGCSGLQYTLDFTKEKGKFDEVVTQEGVTVLVESKALLSILGSEMDYIEDKLSSQFVFHNPNVKESCGCGQSFMV